MASFNTSAFVTDARDKIGRVRLFLQKCAGFETKKREAAAPFDADLKRLDEARMPSEADLRKQSHQIIGDLMDNAYGAKNRLEELVAEARKRSELQRPRHD